MPEDARHISCILNVADADRVGVASDTEVANIDIRVTIRNCEPRKNAQGDIVTACGIVQERLETDGRVGAAGTIEIERLETVGRVAAADGVIEERASTIGRILKADGV